ncbi:hypothetical protein HYT91_00950 [Candidatus Pacearchaeota archaeon]|nr:hypothetical protein [Candidatus Pacearchaeota archaeon]
MDTNGHILIIETDQITGLDLQLQLKREGFNISKATKLTDIKDIFERGRPNLIIASTDIKNNQNDFEKLKKLFIKYNLPIIHTSTEPTKRITKEPELKIIGVFSKPFDSKKIARFVDNFFNKGQ